MLNPDWLAVSLFILELALLLYLGCSLAKKLPKDRETLDFTLIKSSALFVVVFASLYIVLVNPFSLIFVVPVLLWFLIVSSQGFSKAFDLLFFLLGELVLYALIYFFRIEILHYGIVFLWMFHNMFTTGTVSFGALMAGTAIFAAGSTLVVNHPQKQSEFSFPETEYLKRFGLF